MTVLTRSRRLATTLLPSASDLCLHDIRQTEHTLELTLSTTTLPARCPVCDTGTMRIHSRYCRRLADLPWGSFAVQVSLQIRKFVCTVIDCPRRIFAERIPAVAAPYARRTTRLGDLLRAVGFALGGEGGHRLAARLRVETSPSTLIRLIRRTPDASMAVPRVLGVDDFARRKGRTYGTLLVDLEQHRPIDLLPDRSADTLARWLSAHPGVEIISRDRSTEYTRGARAGAPTAIHVADRFHLLLNFREALERLLDRNRRVLQGIVLPPGSASPEDRIPAHAQRQPVRRSPTEEGARQARTTAVQERHIQIHALHEHGMSIRGIAQHLHLSRGTIYRYLRLEPSVVGPRRHAVPSNLDRYLPYLYQRWLAGCTNAAQLWREVRDQGYAGSRKMVAVWVRQQRLQPAPTTPRKYVTAASTPQRNEGMGTPSSGARPASSRQLAWLLVRDPQSLTAVEHAILTTMKAQCPDVAATYPLIQEWLRIVRQRDADALPSWREAVANQQVPELVNYVNGLERDADAVQAALTVAWSNGQTEGQVNRLKTIKRQMYGRANFDLLRKRVLNAA